MNKRKRSFMWQFTLICMLSFMGMHMASGGILGMLFSNSIKYQIKVVDGKNQPIPNATIWILRSGPERPDIRQDFMERLLTRYSRSINADYVHFFGHNINPQLEVDFTPSDGALVKEYERNDIGKGDHLPVSIAAIKRGYSSTMVYEETPVGDKRTITLRLTPNPKEQVNPGMLQFDLLRAQVANGALGATSQEKAEYLENIHQQIVVLAQKFEREGKVDDAAILYHYMAYMPSVVRRTNASGKLVISGYTNGYDKREPQRVNYLNRSLQLNKSNPQISYEKAFGEFQKNGIEVWGNKEKHELRARYIEMAENYLKEYPEQMWPSIYATLVNAYQGQRDLAKACQMLNRFHHFEPSFYDKATWLERAEMFRSVVRLEKLSELKKLNPSLRADEVPVDFRCEIVGL